MTVVVVTSTSECATNRSGLLLTELLLLPLPSTTHSSLAPAPHRPPTPKESSPSDALPPLMKGNAVEVGDGGSKGKDGGDSPGP